MPCGCSKKTGDSSVTLVPPDGNTDQSTTYASEIEAKAANIRRYQSQGTVT